MVTRYEHVGVSGYYLQHTDQKNVRQQLTPFTFWVPMGSEYIHDFPYAVEVQHLHVSTPDIARRIEDTKIQAVEEFKESLRTIGTEALHEKLNEILWLSDIDED